MKRYWLCEIGDADPAYELAIFDTEPDEKIKKTLSVLHCTTLIEESIYLKLLDAAKSVYKCIMSKQSTKQIGFANVLENLVKEFAR